MKAAYKAYGTLRGWGSHISPLHFLPLLATGVHVELSGISRSGWMCLFVWVTYAYHTPEERMLVELKQEMPGLKLSQYKVSPPVGARWLGFRPLIW